MPLGQLYFTSKVWGSLRQGPEHACWRYVVLTISRMLKSCGIEYDHRVEKGDGHVEQDNIAMSGQGEV